MAFLFHQTSFVTNSIIASCTDVCCRKPFWNLDNILNLIWNSENLLFIIFSTFFYKSVIICSLFPLLCIGVAIVFFCNAVGACPVFCLLSCFMWKKCNTKRFQKKYFINFLEVTLYMNWRIYNHEKSENIKQRVNFFVSILWAWMMQIILFATKYV